MTIPIMVATSQIVKRAKIMLLHLVRKDILIAKKLVLISLLVIIAVPVFIIWTVPAITNLGIVPFIYMVILGELLILQTVSQIEAKNPKAAALLCAAPYPRSTFVKAKYTLFLLIFAYCYIVHTIVMFFSNTAGILDLSAILVVLLLDIIIFGIYLPFEFKYEFAKARLFFMIMILASSIGPSTFFKLFPNFIDFSMFQSMPLTIQCLSLAISAIIILCISLLLSIRVYAKKEL